MIYRCSNRDYRNFCIFSFQSWHSVCIMKTELLIKVNLCFQSKKNIFRSSHGKWYLPCRELTDLYKYTYTNDIKWHSIKEKNNVFQSNKGGLQKVSAGLNMWQPVTRRHKLGHNSSQTYNKLPNEDYSFPRKSLKSHKCLVETTFHLLLYNWGSWQAV